MIVTHPQITTRHNAVEVGEKYIYTEYKKGKPVMRAQLEILGIKETTIDMPAVNGESPVPIAGCRMHVKVIESDNTYCPAGLTWFLSTVGNWGEHELPWKLNSIENATA